MALGLAPDLLAIVLFLLPGFAGIKLGLKIDGRGDWFNRVETTAVSFSISLFSMFFLYVFGSLVKFSYNPTKFFLTEAELTTALSQLPHLVPSYLLLVLVSLSVGGVLGLASFGTGYFQSSRPWARFYELAKNDSKNEACVIRVRTSAGDEVIGRVDHEGEAALNKDITLKEPRVLRFDESGEIADDSSWSGYAYIHSQSLVHIEFDRLSDADETEIRRSKKQGQQTISGASRHESDEEMDELEELAREADEEDDSTSV